MLQKEILRQVYTSLSSRSEFHLDYYGLKPSMSNTDIEMGGFTAKGEGLWEKIAVKLGIS